MVKKKSQSKRQTLKMKYKIQKKVKEHKKKLNKASRKAIKAGRKPKPKKNPGIPNAWPFKEELLLSIAAQRRKQERLEEEAKERRRQERADFGRGRHHGLIIRHGINVGQNHHARRVAACVAVGKGGDALHVE